MLAMKPDKPKIFLTRQLPPDSMAILHEQSILTMNAEDRVLNKQEIIDGVTAVDGLLCLLTDTIDDEILAANPNLKVVANFAVGFNNIDVAAATKRGIPVTNTPGVLTETTADMAWALLMAAGRRVVEGDRYVRTKQWQGWGPLQFLGADITGSTLGLIGMGRIGRAMVQRAKAFNMNIIYWNRTRLSEVDERALRNHLRVNGRRARARRLCLGSCRVKRRYDTPDRRRATGLDEANCVPGKHSARTIGG